MPSPGAWIPYDLPDMGIEGPAKVLSIGACPAMKPGFGRVVLSTYRRMASNLMEMHVDGLGGPIEATANHPVFSADRCEWVAVGELLQGESVKTLLGTGSVQVFTKPSPLPVREVWNLEVEGEHVYAVGLGNLVAHNAYNVPGPSAWKQLAKSAANRRGLHPGEISRRFHRIKDDEGLSAAMDTFVDDVTGDVFNNVEGHERFGALIGNIFRN